MHQPMNKYSRRVNFVRVEFARLDDNLRFRDSDLATRRSVGVEVAGGAPVDQVSFHAFTRATSAKMPCSRMQVTPPKSLCSFPSATNVPTPVRV